MEQKMQLKAINCIDKKRERGRIVYEMDGWEFIEQKAWIYVRI